MSTRHAILGLLALGERYGYEMRRELEALDGAWRIEYGQLYRLLGTLEERGLVTVRQAPGRGGPQRKLYGLTSNGRAELEAWLEEPATDVRHQRDELPLKLKIARGLGAEGLGAMVASRRAELESQRVALIEARDRARLARDLDRWLVVETRLHHVEGSLRALDAYEALAAEPRERPSAGAIPGSILCAGSDDPILELLGRHLARSRPATTFTSRPVGSLAGLLILKEGGAHVAGTHLLDVETGEYNVPFIKRLLFEEPVVLVNLVYREQGLMVADQNPKGIECVADVATREVRLVNRQRGAGTRLLLLARLREAGIDPGQVEGFESEAPTHDAVAAAVANGEADVGMGIRAVAEGWGLDFIPVGRERYDLAMTRAHLESPRLAPLIEALNDDSFRDLVEERVGYDGSEMGSVVAEIS